MGRKSTGKCCGTDGSDRSGGDRKSRPESGSGCLAIDRLVAFQETNCGFEGVWEEIRPIVRDNAKKALRKYRALAPYGVDAWALDDVEQQVAVKLMKLGVPGATGRFDPARAKPGLSGLTGWLWKVVAGESLHWKKKYHCGAGRKVVAMTNLEFNGPADAGDGSSFEKILEAKMSRPDLLPILEECIARLPDEFMREVASLKLSEGLSLRKTATRLGVSTARVQRTLTAAYEELWPLVIARGVDEDWFDGLAA
jgi:RNA polymerase sigma factor (sigma-70 family)